jgi:hypothetical protein
LYTQDASDLCSLLHTSFAFYRSAGFEHSRFLSWLDSKLKSIAVSTNGRYSREELDVSKAGQLPFPCST